jgi:hypothetical protein
MKTAVEWLQMVLIPIPYDEEDVEHNKICWEKAKEMEKEQKIQAQIEILYSIGNNGANAPLYGILKTTLLDLQEQLKQQEK